MNQYPIADCVIKTLLATKADLWSKVGPLSIVSGPSRVVAAMISDSYATARPFRLKAMS